MSTILKSMLVGYAVLTVAIAMNFLATTMGLATWYAVFEGTSLAVADYLFLSLLYPLSLGLSAVVAIHLWERVRDPG